MTSRRKTTNECSSPKAAVAPSAAGIRTISIISSQWTTTTLRDWFEALYATRVTTFLDVSEIVHGSFVPLSHTSKGLNMPTKITEEREQEYHEAWAISGELMAHPQVLEGLNDMGKNHPRILYPWIQILNKLIRALSSPTKIDHWKDIAGYATLVSDELEKDKPNG
jgi:hypothetical protein